ncbi:uncharacterized protein LOC131671242 [Phymastichus coffea]|uniref:uncharacterized protein LOC131671242 n=1 Tax=Phymastichus coffea TaxID=108790 RepID=UPI00273AA245|nr:uncharacterized protein LOC131671242 [Phymastichus coffea]XP_058803493.1 uncharacterized protein LOC131671242 [Phymastichus coffea]XP_058803494.1 uncharacterized protein LOC131671242 [Phymastichus coffea]
MGCSISKNKPNAVPYPLASHTRKEWIAWRNCFLAYMNEKNNIPAHKQGSQFYQYIGNTGIEISKKFYFHDVYTETDVDTILFKFDVYFIFGSRTKHADESISNYIKALEVIAQKTAENNVDRVIKEKILQDLISRNVFNKFLEMVPSFSNISDYESLSLQELTFIWEESEKLNKSSIHDDALSKSPIINCIYCGSNHMINECAASTKECSNCIKSGHFSWRCSTDLHIPCELCGQHHTKNKEKCPANKHLCNNCHKLGHFSFRCRSRRNSKKKC